MRHRTTSLLSLPTSKPKAPLWLHTANIVHHLLNTTRTTHMRYPSLSFSFLAQATGDVLASDSRNQQQRLQHGREDAWHALACWQQHNNTKLKAPPPAQMSDWMTARTHVNVRRTGRHSVGTNTDHRAQAPTNSTTQQCWVQAHQHNLRYTQMLLWCVTAAEKSCGA